MAGSIFVKVTKAEEDEDDSFYPLEKLIRISDIRDVDCIEYEDDRSGGCLINFYDGDSMIVFESIDELHQKLEKK